MNNRSNQNFNFLMNNEVLLGLTDYNELCIAKLDDKNIIKNFENGDFIDGDNTADGNSYFWVTGWGGDNYKLGKKTFKLGDTVKPNMRPINIKKEFKKQLQNAYTSESIHSCGSCGLYHDLSDDYSRSFIITDDGEVYCKDCVSLQNVLVEVNKPSDIFRSRDLEGRTMPEEYTEVATLFCDSSGFGSPSERALTKAQAEDKVDSILNANEGVQLYSALTGIGQFQVYVTIYKKEGEK